MDDRQLIRIEDRLIRVEEKLDNHLERVSKLEEAMSFVKGHINIVTAVGIAVVGTLLTLILSK